MEPPEGLEDIEINLLPLSLPNGWFTTFIQSFVSPISLDRNITYSVVSDATLPYAEYNNMTYIKFRVYIDGNRASRPYEEPFPYFAFVIGH